MSAASQNDSRPLSPHLQVYRPQLTSVLSILHRATGVVLSVGTLLMACWLAALASGPESFAVVQGYLGHWFGQLALLGWTFSLFYHLANGVRHLAWDAGWGFEMRQVYLTGYAVIAASLLLTAATWYLACA